MRADFAFCSAAKSWIHAREHLRQRNVRKKYPQLPQEVRQLSQDLFDELAVINHNRCHQLPSE